MPRRRAVTREQLEVLLVLPATETELIRHWTLIAAAAVLAERQVAHQLTRDLPPEQAKTLDALLTTKGSE
jgi:hypothetical protein